MQPDYRIIFFTLSVLAALPVLFYYYRRHPNPRFRPRFGEMALVSLLVLFVCGGASYFVGGLLQDPDQLKAQAEMTDYIAAEESESDRDSDRDKKDKSKSSRDNRRFPRSYQGGLPKEINRQGQ